MGFFFNKDILLVFFTITFFVLSEPLNKQQDTIFPKANRSDHLGSRVDLRTTVIIIVEDSKEIQVINGAIQRNGHFYSIFTMTHIHKLHLRFTLRLSPNMGSWHRTSVKGHQLNLLFFFEISVCDRYWIFKRFFTKTMD